MFKELDDDLNILKYEIFSINESIIILKEYLYNIITEDETFQKTFSMKSYQLLTEKYYIANNKTSLIKKYIELFPNDVKTIEKLLNIFPEIKIIW